MYPGLVTRRNLPHWYVPGAAHFVTFRLAGTLPVHVLHDLQERKQQLLDNRPSGVLPAEHRNRVHKQLFAQYDNYLDRNRDIAWLAEPRVASLVRRSLHHLHDRKYALLAYSIMPNHVHVLFLPYDVKPHPGAPSLEEPGESSDTHGRLSAIMHSLKSYTAHEANKILRRSGQFWQHESYDHWLRDDDELERVVEYINVNAVKAELATTAHEWPWSSVHERFLHDGDTSGWLALPMSATKNP